jgi:ribosomal protein S25
MSLLEVTLHKETIDNKVKSISVVIQWDDQACGKEDAPLISEHSTAIQSNVATNAAACSSKKNRRSRRATVPRSPDRLLPTDRLILNALLARIPQGKQITKPVRLQELMEECEISRSQARICLKRLTEKGLIKRISDGVKLGSQEGYSYKISPVLR